MACSYNPLFIYQVLFDLFRGGVFEQHPFLRVEQIKCRHGFQVVHRIPRRFLFIRWGTKALRQEIVPSNPHTRIVYSEYVKIER